MKYWNVNIIINYTIEAETENDAIEQAEISFSEDTHPFYNIVIEDSWEE